MTNDARIYNREMTVSSISGSGKTGRLHIKEWTGLYICVSFVVIKMDYILILIYLKGRPDTIKLIEENIGRRLFEMSQQEKKKRNITARFFLIYLLE